MSRVLLRTIKAGYTREAAEAASALAADNVDILAAALQVEGEALADTIEAIPALPTTETENP